MISLYELSSVGLFGSKSPLAGGWFNGFMPLCYNNILIQNWMVVADDDDADNDTLVAGLG